MELSYKTKESYSCACDEKGDVNCCTIKTIVEIYDGRNFLVSTVQEKSISLDEMKKIIENLKG